MPDTHIDPLIKRAVAQAIMQRATLDLDALLAELAEAVQPFPNFMGITTIQAIEIEPTAISNPNSGCIVICPDGKLRELILRMIPAPFDIGGTEQTDEMAELDLPPAEYLAYAYAAVHQLLSILETQRQA